MAISADDVTRLYRQYLHRDPGEDDIAKWQSGEYGATDLAGVESQISTSGEAQDYTAAHGGGAAGGGSGGGGGYTPGDSAPSIGTGNGPGLWDSGAGSGSSTFGPWTGHFTAPTPQALPDAPEFHAPAYEKPPAFAYDDAAHPKPVYEKPPAFSYADFTAPSYEEAQNDPGYQFRLQQGTDRLQNAASARGTLNDSGTLKALMDYGQGAASQEYGNVWDRAMGSYTTNRGNALGTYNTNYATQYTDPYNAAVNQYTADYGHALDTYNTNYKTQFTDPYAASYKAAQDAFAPQMAGWQTSAQNTQHGNDIANTNMWNDYLLGFQDYGNRRNLGVNFALGS